MSNHNHIDFAIPPDAVWKLLPGGPVAMNLGEVWQFMGTVDGIHTFRHRLHPSDDRRRYLGITAKPPHRVRGSRRRRPLRIGGPSVVVWLLDAAATLLARDR